MQLKYLLLLLILLSGCTPQLGVDVRFDVVKYETEIPTVDFKVVEWTEPTTDLDWAEDTKRESLHLKFDDQLQEMLTSHQVKLERTLDELYIVEKYPDSLRAELEKQGELTVLEIEAEVQSQLNYWRWKAEKLTQSVSRIEKEIDLRVRKVVEVIEKIPAGDPRRFSLGNTRSPLGTTYYIDPGCATPGDGTTATCNGDADDSYDEYQDFTVAARTAGDVGIVRRGTASTTAMIDLNFTSDGNVNSPITLEADYTDEWGDFANSAQTYTITRGSKTMTASATITGIAANDWICVNTENCKDWAYEVASVSGTTLTLYLPYKGKSSGVGNTLVVMPDAPIWGTTTCAAPCSWVMSGDYNWRFQGFDVRSADTGGTLDILRDYLTTRDMIFQSNGSGATSYDVAGGWIIAEKQRFFNTVAYSNGLSTVNSFSLSDAYYDGNNDNTNRLFAVPAGIVFAKDIEVVNLEGTGGEVVDMGSIQPARGNKIRNLVYDESGAFGRINNTTGFSAPGEIFIEDYNGVGRNFQLVRYNGINDDFFTQSTTTSAFLRSGGGLSTMIITPGSSLATNNYYKLPLFEYPIKADTTSRTYTMYFNSTSTAHWTADPTAVEMYLQAEYYVNATDATRVTATSTGTLNFTGSTDWQGLSITVQPAQAGILYLSGWYGKPKESGTDDTNAFYMDVQPVIE